MSSADVVQNKVNLFLAKQQRLLESWLPPRTAEELAQAKTEEELEREDAEIFHTVPTSLGVGAKPGEASREDDRFRKTMLGKGTGRETGRERERGDAGKGTGRGRERGDAGKGMGRGRERGDAGKGMGTGRPKMEESGSEDEDLGRSSVGRKKRKRPVEEAKKADVEEAKKADVEAGEKADPADEAKPDAITGSKIQRTGYLDEVLAQKRKKRKKRKAKI